MLMIQKRSPLMHKLISLLCLIAILLPLISISVPVQADAASSYKVKQWSDGNGTYYYYVYKGSLPRYYEPTFIRHDWMNYYSDSGDIRIAIYDPYGSPNKAHQKPFINICCPRPRQDIPMRAGTVSVPHHTLLTMSIRLKAGTAIFP